MTTLEDPTPDEKAHVGALLWRFHFISLRMTGQRKRVRQMLAKTAPASSELHAAVVTVGGTDDIPEVPASMRSEFADKAGIIDSVLLKLCDGGTLDLTPDEKAIVGALLWRFHFTLLRMTGQRGRVRQMLAETAPAIPSELHAAVDLTVGGMGANIQEVPASMRSEFAHQARIIDSVLRKLCEGEFNRVRN